MVVVNSDCSNVCCMVGPVCVVGVSLSDSVCFPSIRIGLEVLLCIFIVLLLMAARVGGGQLLDFVASTSISWLGRSVLISK